MMRLNHVDAAIGCVVLLGLFVPERVEAEIPSQAEKYFSRYCIRCHGPQVQKADFRLDDLSGIDAGTAPQWKKVLERLSLGEMPPPDELQPSLAETEPVTDWITRGLEPSSQRQSSAPRTRRRAARH